MSRKKTFDLSDETWRRHANAWSVWTRMAAFPPMVAAIYFRDVLGFWTLVVLAAGVVWMWLDPRVFPAIDHPRSWAEKGIYGERMWWHDGSPEAKAHRTALRWIQSIAGVGGLFMVYGLVFLDPWPTFFGWTFFLISQLWQIDRFVAIYQESVREQ